MKHAKRANYQPAIWRRCLEHFQKVSSPVGRGWNIEKEEGVEQLVVHRMDGQPAPQVVLDMLNQNQNQDNLYSTHVVTVQTKYYCTVLNMEIVYENMKIIHCIT